MKRKSKIEKVIKDFFVPYYFSVLDVSEQHRGHQGFREDVESHFEIVIVSKIFDNKNKKIFEFEMDKIVKKNIDYDQIVEETLRLVVKKSLELVNEEGLPGDHHFYISFDSTHDGVKVPSELKAGEDNEIKIILQHQFWDLTIDDQKFSVVLSFNGREKNISVPFSSIISFSDPSVGFSLQFKKDLLTQNTKKENK